MVVWFPPLLPFSEPLPVAPQAWFPLFCYVRDREAAVHHPTPPSGGIAVPKVVRSEGLVQDWGLFPASDLEAQVLVQCSSSPSGYGTRRLTGMELGGLWDLPISIMDALPPSEAELMLRAFCKTVPTKVLLAGADLLLTMSFRWGLGGLKPNFGGLKSVEAHHSDSPHHLLTRHPTCWMRSTKGIPRKRTTRRYRFISGSALLRGDMGIRAV